HWVCGFHLDPPVGAQLFQRDELLPFSSLNRHSATPLGRQKRFQRPKQIRPKSPPFPADTVQISVLQQRREKTLGNVLCLRRRKALSPQKRENRPPIRAAKFFQ